MKTTENKGRDPPIREGDRGGNLVPRFLHGQGLEYSFNVNNGLVVQSRRCANGVPVLPVVCRVRITGVARAQR
jgi:hypothetical protein